VPVDADERGIIVTGRLSGGVPVRPTRDAEVLRRRAVNRARRRQRLAPLPPVVAGDCEACEGWGVVGDERRRRWICRATGTTPR
jgi:hypothetical protein